MPQKHNPISAQLLTVLASKLAGHAEGMLRASVQDHERASGRWVEEWGLVPEALVCTGGALDIAIDLLEGLEIDADRMRANVEGSEFIVSEAVMMAIARHIGRQRAHDVVAGAVQTAVAKRISFQLALSSTPEIAEHLSGDELARVLQPDRYLGATDAFIDRALANEATPSFARDAR